jgi:hypothetical protein
MLPWLPVELCRYQGPRMGHKSVLVCLRYRLLHVRALLPLELLIISRCVIINVAGASLLLRLDRARRDAWSKKIGNTPRSTYECKIKAVELVFAAPVRLPKWIPRNVDRVHGTLVPDLRDRVKMPRAFVERRLYALCGASR